MFRRRQQYKPDPEALTKILAEEPPHETVSTPLRLSLGKGQLIAQVIGVAVSVGVLVFIGRVLSTDPSFLALFALGLLLFHAAGVVGLAGSFDLTITVSSDGVRKSSLFGEKLIRWWEHPTIAVAPDLTVVDIRTSSKRIRVTLITQVSDSRVALVQALRRGALQHGDDVAKARQPNRFARTATSTLLSLGGSAAIVAAVTWFAPGSVLGLRCSVNGEYFQETFATPARQGCVVLRVSAGAEKAGIRQGDLIVEVNGIPITSGTQFTIVFKELGDRAQYHIKVIRGGKTLEFDVRLGRRKTVSENPDDPIFYYLRAREEASGDPIQAIEDYTTAIRLEPRFDLAYLYRAELYDEVGDHQAASTDFLKAIDLSPSLGEAHLLFARHERDFARDITAAFFRVRKAIELDGCEGDFEKYNVDCNEEYYLLGVLQTGYYDLQEPIVTLEQAIRFWPQAPEPYCVLATYYERSSRTEDAVAYAQKYLDFREEDRFLNCELDARRIVSRVTASPGPSFQQTVSPIDETTRPTPSGSIGDCIDFSQATCPPF